MLNPAAEPAPEPPPAPPPAPKKRKQSTSKPANQSLKKENGINKPKQSKSRNGKLSIYLQILTLLSFSLIRASLHTPH